VGRIERRSSAPTRIQPPSRYRKQEFFNDFGWTIPFGSPINAPAAFLLGRPESQHEPQHNADEEQNCCRSKYVAAKGVKPIH
jgi:hypothetical protein